MSLVRETNSDIIAQFVTPAKGTRRPETVAVHTLPVDAVSDSMNVFIHRGKLRSRPGFTSLKSKTDPTQVDQLLVDPIIGGTMLTTPREKILLLSSRRQTVTISDINPTTPGSTILTMATDDLSVVDVIPTRLSGVDIAILVSRDNTPALWTDEPRSLASASTIPSSSSGCIASSRLVVFTYPHTISWSNVNNPPVFDSNAVAIRAQSGDRGVVVRSLTALSFAFYKERSIHVARAAGGLTESTAFAFNEPIYTEGPAGIYAIANVDGVHIYMTASGRIGIFDGTRRPIWIADGIWQFLQNDININYSYLIRAVYDYRLNIVIFFYPKKNDEYNGQRTVYSRGMVIINLPFEGIDIEGETNRSAFIGQCNIPTTHAVEKRWSIDEIDNSAVVFTLPDELYPDRSAAMAVDINSINDVTNTFTSSFQTGLQAMPDARHTQVTIENFVERGQGYGAVLIQPVVSDALENPSGDIPDLSGQYIDLETNPVREYKGFNRQVRFFGVRYTWTSDNHMRYSGAVVYGSSLPKYRK